MHEHATATTSGPRRPGAPARHDDRHRPDTAPAAAPPTRPRTRPRPRPTRASTWRARPRTRRSTSPGPRPSRRAPSSVTPSSRSPARSTTRPRRAATSCRRRCAPSVTTCSRWPSRAPTRAWPSTWPARCPTASARSAATSRTASRATCSRTPVTSRDVAPAPSCSGHSPPGSWPDACSARRPTARQPPRSDQPATGYGAGQDLDSGLAGAAPSTGTGPYAHRLRHHGVGAGPLEPTGHAVEPRPDRVGPAGPAHAGHAVTGPTGIGPMTGGQVPPATSASGSHVTWSPATAAASARSWAT